jgi:tetratricopeptide (TPR) repeat protein
MQNRYRAGINVKVLLIVGVAGGLLVVGAYFAHKYRQRLLVDAARTAGLEAFQNQDWQEAYKQFGRWLNHHPMDVEILRPNAQAHLAVERISAGNLGAAMRAYRTILRVNPDDDEAFERLVKLYLATNNIAELMLIAEQRLDANATDATAMLARAKSLVFQQKYDLAIEQLEQMVDAHESNPEVADPFVEACILLSELAAVYNSVADHEVALGWLERAAARRPESAWVRSHLAVRKRQLAAALFAANERAAADAMAAEAKADRQAALALTFDDPRTYLLSADECLTVNDLDNAAQVLQRALTVPREVVQTEIINPTDWDYGLFRRRAMLAIAQDHPEEGAELADAAMEQLGWSNYRVSIMPMAAELYIEAARFADAREMLDTYIEQAELMDPSAERDAEVAFLEAKLAWAQDDPYGVVRYLAPLVDQGELPPPAIDLLARAYERTGQAGRLVESLGPELNASGQLGEVRLRMARNLIERGRWQAALQVLDPLAVRLPDNYEIGILQLSARLGQAVQTADASLPNSLAEIEAALRKLIAARPERPEAYLILSSTLEQRDGPAAAQAVLADAIDNCEGTLPLRLELAETYARADQPAEVARILRDACDAEPANATPWAALSEWHLRQNDTEAARRVLEEGLTNVADTGAQRSLGVRLATLDLMSDEPDAALGRLQQIAADNPRDVQVRGLLLQLPAVQRDEEYAAQLLQEMQEIEGAAGVLWRFHTARLAMAREQTAAKRDEIEELLRDCIKTDPSWAAPALLLGRFYEQLGLPERASQVYRLSYESTDSTELGLRWLALLQDLGRLDEARQLIARLSRSLDERTASALRVSQAVGEGAYDAAIQELEGRLGAEQRGGADAVILAQLRFQKTGDADAALQLLDQAAETGAAAADVARTRASILATVGRQDEALAVLDAHVAEAGDVQAYLLRASYHEQVGNAEAAEEDYVKITELSGETLAYMVLGEFYAKQRQWDRAIDAWEIGLKGKPSVRQESNLQRALAKALLLRNQPGDRDRAAALVDDATASGAADAELAWVRAVALAKENSAESIAQLHELLREVPDMPPGSVDAYAGLANFALQLNDAATAREIALRGLQVAGDGSPTLTGVQARAELALGNVEAAERLARAVFESDPNNRAAFVVQGGVALRRNDQASLRELLPRIEKHLADEDAPAIMHLLHADVLAALDRLQEAIAALEAYTPEARDGTRSVRLALVDFNRRAGNLAAAEQWLVRAEEVALPEDPMLLERRAALLIAQQKFDELRSFLAADQPAGQNVGLLLGTASQLQVAPPQLPLAIEFVRRAIDLTDAPAPDQASLLGMLVYQTGDIAEARRIYEKLVETHPNHAEALNNLAWILADAFQETEQAAPLARKAVTLAPESANYRDTLGYILRRWPGHLAEARDEFRRGVDLAPAGSVLRAQLLARLSDVCNTLEDWSTLRPYRDELTELADKARERGLTAEETGFVRQALQQLQA